MIKWFNLGILCLLMMVCAAIDITMRIPAWGQALLSFLVGGLSGIWLPIWEKRQ